MLLIVAWAFVGTALLWSAELNAQNVPFSVSVDVVHDTLGAAVNRNILGANAPWIDNGENLLKPNTLTFASPMIDRVKNLKPTSLRYPGGNYADVYFWKNGSGPLASRGQCEHFYSRTKQTVFYGTDEFLNTCQQTSAVPLITVNMHSGTAQEAAQWVNYINVQRVKTASGTLLPRVQYWELGNEPYLEDRPDLALTTANYVSKANEFIQAMKAVDPTIQVGIPLRSDKIGGQYATPRQGFNAAVLKGVTQPFEWVALHNAYMPFVYQGNPCADDMYKAGVAASQVVNQDLVATRTQLQQLRPGKATKLAITEYNAIFNMYSATAAPYSASMAGAIVMADLISLFARQTDLLFCHHWSLSSNGYFGAMDWAANYRPAYWVVQGISSTLLGNLINTTTTGPTLSNPAAGFVPAMTNTPAVSVLATRQNNVVRLLVINKNSTSTANVRFALRNNPAIAAASFLELYTTGDLFATNTPDPTGGWKPRVITTTFPQVIGLRPASISLLTVTLK